MAAKKGVKLFISIVERGQGKALTRFFEAQGLTCHFQTVGHGTASSDLLDLLGIGSPERDILISLGEQGKVQKMMGLLEEEEEPEVRAKGILFSMPLTALNMLAAAVLMRDTQRQDFRYHNPGNRSEAEGKAGNVNHYAGGGDIS